MASKKAKKGGTMRKGGKKPPRSCPRKGAVQVDGYFRCPKHTASCYEGVGSHCCGRAQRERIAAHARCMPLR